MSLLDNIKALTEGESITLSDGIILTMGKNRSFSISVNGTKVLVLDIVCNADSLSEDDLNTIIQACENYRDGLTNENAQVMEAPNLPIQDSGKAGLRKGELFNEPKRTTRQRPK